MINKIRDLFSQRNFSDFRWLKSFSALLLASHDEDPLEHQEILIPYIKEHLPTDFRWVLFSYEELIEISSILPLPVFSLRPFSKRVVLPPKSVLHFISDLELNLTSDLTSLGNLETALQLPYLKRLILKKWFTQYEPLKIFTCVSTEPTLETLEFRNDSLQKTDLEHITEAGCLQNLQTLKVPHNPIGWDGLKSIFNSLVFKKLRFLNVAYCQLGDPYIPELTDFQVETLEKLNMTANKIQSEGLTSLAKVKTFQKLKSLSLVSNYIEDEGLINLAASENFQSLEELDLSFNLITGEGLVAFSQSPYFPNLKTINLSRNQVGPESIQVFLKSKYFKNLEVLKVNGRTFEMLPFKSESSDCIVYH